MKNQLVTAINHLAAERGLPKEVVLEAIEAALVSAYKRNYGASGSNIKAKVDPLTGEMHIYAEKKVVEKVADPRTQISLAEARAIDPEADIGGTVALESTPDNFGRIAAQTAKQVIMQRIREAERETTYKRFAELEGEIVTGRVQRYNSRTGDVIVNLEHSEGILAKEDQLPNEHYRRDSRISAYLKEVRKGTRGAVIKLSRTHRNMLRRLLEREVPEIAQGIVEIKAIAREPGYRSKVAVAALQPGVEPVGCCVGMRGSRIQNVVNELSGEKIDVIAWSPDTRTFIKNALSPAQPSAVLLEEGENGRTAIVIVPDKQLSLAIGREGQNARLAAKLTGWRIDIKGETEAAEEGLIERAHEQARLEALMISKRKKDLLEAAQAILLRGPEAVEAEAMPEAEAAPELVEVQPEAVEKAEEEAPEEVEAAIPEKPEAAETAEITAEKEEMEAAVPMIPEAAETAEVTAETAEEEVQQREQAEEAEEIAEPESVAEKAPLEEGEEAEEQLEEEYELEFEEFEEELEEEEEEIEIEIPRKGSKRKKGKARKRRILVYDEVRGETIAIRPRKRQRSDWDEYDELI